MTGSRYVLSSADLVNGSVTAVVGSAGDYYVKVDPDYRHSVWGHLYADGDDGCDVCEQ